MLLPSLITLRHPAEHVLSPEDIFGSTLGSIFTDDLQNQHGDDANTVIIYKNARHGEFELRTADVNGEEQRRKFAHYLWNAGILMAELVGGQPVALTEAQPGDEEGWKNGEWWVTPEEAQKWSVEGETVLELGAGVGLGGMMSTIAGAREVTVTDYPAPPILEAIKANISKNISSDLQTRITVQGHLWGSASTVFEEAHAKRYTRILAADCLWMLGEHDNLASSMAHFLSDSPHARIFCIAGFHTGRAKVVPFFEEAVPGHGLEIEEIYEMDADGKRRPWARERDSGREHIGERKKWLVLARIRRRTN